MLFRSSGILGLPISVVASYSVLFHSSGISLPVSAPYRVNWSVPFCFTPFHSAVLSRPQHSPTKRSRSLFWVIYQYSLRALNTNHRDSAVIFSAISGCSPSRSFKENLLIHAPCSVFFTENFIPGLVSLRSPSLSAHSDHYIMQTARYQLSVLYWRNVSYARSEIQKRKFKNRASSAQEATKT